METRQKTEYKYYVLCLASMHGGVDKAISVAIFDDLEKLKEYYNSQLAETSWTDEASADSYGNVHTWHKVFKKGSLLEWFNPMNTFEVVYGSDLAFGGITESWSEAIPHQDSFNIPFNPSI